MTIFQNKRNAIMYKQMNLKKGIFNPKTYKKNGFDLKLY